MLFELSFAELRSLIQDLLAFAICSAAFVWGGAPERVIAAGWVIVFEVSARMYRAIAGDGLQLTQIDPVLAAADGAVGVVFVAVALYANRNYPLWLAGMQVMVMTAHLARALTDTISPLAYYLMLVVPGWAQLLLLAIGLARHCMRQRTYGDYRDWRVVRSPHGPGVLSQQANVVAAVSRLRPRRPRDETK